MFNFDLLGLVILCLALFTAGYGVCLLISRHEEGYRFLSRTRVIKLDPSDPKIALGIQVGLISGYWAACGEDKDYGQVVDEYLTRLKQGKEVTK